MNEADLEQILIGLNATPQKILEYKSPFEALERELRRTIPSPRTVESHLNHIKDKLGLCRK